MRDARVGARIAFEPFLDDDTRRYIVDGVDMYNVAVTGLPDYAPVNFVLRGERGDVLGGVLGLLWGAWLQVGTLWVASAARGKGYGAKLLSAAEEYALTKGAVGATLETYSFQARPFYERLGYEVCGQLDGYPPGHAKFFLRKSLRRAGVMERDQPQAARVRQANEADADLFPEVEQSAGLLFRTDPELAWLADAENLSADRYREMIAEGWSWIAERPDGRAVGFAAVTRQGRELHLWELAVALDQQRRGIGRQLLQRLMSQAAASGIFAVTLTTFRDLPWNMPFYRSIGFEPVAPRNLEPRLAELLAAEVQKGLPAARRCAMRKVLLS